MKRVMIFGFFIIILLVIAFKVNSSTKMDNYRTTIIQTIEERYGIQVEETQYSYNKIELGEYTSYLQTKEEPFLKFEASLDLYMNEIDDNYLQQYWPILFTPIAERIGTQFLEEAPITKVQAAKRLPVTEKVEPFSKQYKMIVYYGIDKSFEEQDYPVIKNLLQALYKEAAEVSLYVDYRKGNEVVSCGPDQREKYKEGEAIQSYCVKRQGQKL
ncbi:hypothetical protein ACIQXF_21235 [Lysinibacillus sp. NPDC097231]|uniref:hypothetical protein n=1 Tax=Lysinibacillus sp. NPDC097231 TaxID=3364142 RepID=UPI0038153963